jgi:trk system potassium uptake protein TrkA
MNIVIAGCGKVGSYLAEVLSKEGFNITAVDVKEEKLRALTGRFDIMSVEGNIISAAVLDEAEVRDADLMIAVTANDELNLLCCALARKHGCRRSIARVRNPEYNDSIDYLGQELGVAMIINPESIAAREIMRMLKLPSGMKVETFFRGKAELLQFRIKPDSVLAGMKVKEVPHKVHRDILVCAIWRNGETFIPDGEFTLQARDIVVIAGDSKASAEFFRMIGLSLPIPKSVMIVGGGKQSRYLCRHLEKARIRTTVIEQNIDVCEQTVREFDHINVVLGDGSDMRILDQEDCGSYDAFIALTGMDEENMFLSLAVKNKYRIPTICKVNRIDFDQINQFLDLEDIINPKQISADYILQYARSMNHQRSSNIETIHGLFGGQVEALEFYLHDLDEYSEIPLADLPIRHGVLIALIMRQSDIIIPRGQDCLEEHDRIIVITNLPGIAGFQDLFTSRTAR